VELFLTKQTLNVEIETLKPHPMRSMFPASRLTIDSLKEEITKHGFLHPISITPENVILSGHKRVLACKELKIERIPAYVIKIPPSYEFLYFVRQNTIPEQITREIRTEIYKHYAKEVFLGKQVKDTKIDKLSKLLSISSNTIKADFASIRKGENQKISVDILTELWRKKLSNPKINFALTENGWICKIQDRNFETAFGPYHSFKHIAKATFEAAISRHFETRTISDTAIMLGNRIKKIREFYGVNQQELAEKLGKSQSTICEWETARIHLSESHIEKVEKACKEIAERSVLSGD
jgi:DNA-binding transcriptional regulator YiaG